MKSALPVASLLLLLSAAADAGAADAPEWQVQIEASARAALLGRLEQDFSSIELTQVSQMSGNPCVHGAPAAMVSSVSTPDLSSRMAVRTQVNCGEPGVQKAVTTWFSVSAVAEVAVSVHDLSAGVEIKESDIRWDRLDVAHARGVPLRRNEWRSTLRTRVLVSAGSPVLEGQLEEVPDVVAGSAVRAVYREGAMVLQFPAVAQNDALLGNELRVSRTGNEQTMRARVVAPGAVEILP
ncbi:MAG: flagellar basal body P-ring formation chaperone FlgA [Hypericibacter sp.]